MKTEPTISMILSLPLLILLCLGVGCCFEKEKENPYTQGRYVGMYCEGVVLELFGSTDIAMDWEGMFDGERYTHSIVASIDTVFLSTLGNREELEEFILEGNPFYFEYKLGGYPRKQYSICEPSAFVTIFNISKMPYHSSPDH